MKNINKELASAWIYKGKDDLLFAKAAFKETEFYTRFAVCASKRLKNT